MRKWSEIAPNVRSVDFYGFTDARAGNGCHLCGCGLCLAKVPKQFRAATAQRMLLIAQFEAYLASQVQECAVAITGALDQSFPAGVLVGVFVGAVLTLAVLSFATWCCRRVDAA